VRRPIRFVAVAGVFLASSSASANGRFPQANQLVVDPADPTHVVVRTTFGLVQTSDAAKSWGWVCERAIGYSGGVAYDPPIAVTKTGAIWAGVLEGLTTTRDRGCTFALFGAPFEGETVVDVSIEAKNGNRGVVLTSTGLSGSGGTFRTFVAETVDDGKSFSRLPADLPTDFSAETIDVAPSNPQRIYVSGRFGAPGKPWIGSVLRSDDRGKSWTRLDLDLLGTRAPYIGAIDPDDDARVYLRLDGDTIDRLVVSVDAGKTWREIATLSGNMSGFALDPTGKRLAIGGPTDGVWVGTNDGKLEKRSNVGALCLTWTSTALYACAMETIDGFSAARSDDEGRTFSPIFRFAALEPLACASTSSTAITCKDYWPGVKGTLPSDAGVDASDAALAREAGELGGTASDVGCRTTNGRSGSVSVWSALAAVAWLRRRRR